jgi:non-ribosomal peptide synthetase component F
VRPETEELIGPLINTLVLCNDLSGDPSFSELVHRVRAIAADAYTHQEVPYEIVLEELHRAYDLSTVPLFQVMATARDIRQEKIELPGLNVEPLLNEHGADDIDVNIAHVDLILVVDDRPEGLRLTSEYPTDLFDASTVARITQALAQLLEMVAADPSLPLSELAAAVASGADLAELSG